MIHYILEENVRDILRIGHLYRKEKKYRIYHSVAIMTKDSALDMVVNGKYYKCNIEKGRNYHDET